MLVRGRGVGASTAGCSGGEPARRVVALVTGRVAVQAAVRVCPMAVVSEDTPSSPARGWSEGGGHAAEAADQSQCGDSGSGGGEAIERSLEERHDRVEDGPGDHLHLRWLRMGRPHQDIIVLLV